MKNLNKKQDWRLISLRLMNAMFFAFLLTFTLSCGRDDNNNPPTPTYAEENPLDGYLTNTGFNQKKTDYVNSVYDYEFGLVFSPNVNGKIKAITVKIPDINTNLRVTIWDATAMTVIRTELVNVSSSNVLITKAISELAMEKDKKYAITMNSNDWYDRSKTDNSVTTYPITSGNIKIWEYRWKLGTTQVYPTNPSSTYYAGDLSFVFQQTN